MRERAAFVLSSDPDARVLASPQAVAQVRARLMGTLIFRPADGATSGEHPPQRTVQKFAFGLRQKPGILGCYFVFCLYIATLCQSLAPTAGTDQGASPNAASHPRLTFDRVESLQEVWSAQLIEGLVPLPAGAFLPEAPSTSIRFITTVERSKYKDLFCIVSLNGLLSERKQYT